MTLLIMTIVISMSISAICSVLEATLLSLSETDLAIIAEKNNMVYRIWKNFKENLNRPIAVILIVNTFAHTIGAALSGVQYEQLFGSKWIALFSVIYSFIMIQWTEILPKTIAVRLNRRVAYITAHPLNFLVKLFTPIVALVNFLNKPFEVKNKKSSNSFSYHITALSKQAAVNNVIEKTQADIITQAAKLNKLTAHDIMVSMDNIKFLHAGLSIHEALGEAHIYHHTRFPLLAGYNSREVIGYVNFKDIVSVLQTSPENPELKAISRPIITFNENVTLPILLNKMTSSFQHMAMIIDNSGNIIGMITLEDIIEEIIGEINDEYDVMPAHLIHIFKDRYLVGGGITCKELNSQLSTRLPETDETLNQWLLSFLKRQPHPEESLLYNDFRYTVRRLCRQQIFEVIIEKVE